MQLDGLSGLATRSIFPFGDGIFCRLKQYWTTAYRFYRLHVSVRPNHGNYLHRASEIDFLGYVRVYGGDLARDPP